MRAEFSNKPSLAAEGYGKEGGSWTCRLISQLLKSTLQCLRESWSDAALGQVRAKASSNASNGY